MAPASSKISANPPASASPEKAKLSIKKFNNKSSLSPKKGSSPTTIYCTGSSFNAVIIWTEHPTDKTKDGFTNPAKIDLRTNREVADSLGVLQVSNTIDCCLFFFFF